MPMAARASGLPSLGNRRGPLPPVAIPGSRASAEQGAGSGAEAQAVAPPSPPLGPDVELDPPRIASITACSRAMAEVLTVVQRLAPTAVTITLTGETGTGKGVVANAIHASSPRAGGPFVVFDCGAAPANLAESELFGHEKGAFTGASASHVGAFERANGGTIFLDEIGELPSELQPRLLRALENRVVRRVGGTRDRAIDVRVVAATNRDLASQVSNRQFRQDLYFRLGAAVVRLPPLRERLEDLPMLVSSILAQLGRAELQLAPDALEALRRHAWPGNVRELKNTLSCALAFVDGNVLCASHLRFLAGTHDDSVLDRLPLGGQSLVALENAAIRQTLVLTGGNKIEAAQRLGIAVSTLYEKLKRMGPSAQALR